jgi:hypothetical protein
MAVKRIHGGITNQEGYTFPGPYFTSPWGEELFAGTPQLIANPAPLTGRPQGDRHDATNVGPYHVGYPGTIGGMSILAASVVGLFDPVGYYGDLPQSEQNIVAAVPPWERD